METIFKKPIIRIVNSLEQTRILLEKYQKNIYFFQNKRLFTNIFFCSYCSRSGPIMLEDIFFTSKDIYKC